MKTSHRSIARTAIAIIAFAAIPAYATNGTWNQTAAGTSYTWNTPANWGGTTPNAISDTATLNTNLAGNQTISLGSTNVTLGSLSLGTTTGTFTYTLSTGTFTLNNSGAGAAITELSNTSGGDTISAAIVTADTLSNTIGSNSTLATSSLTITGGVTGTQPLTFAANNAGAISVKTGSINVGTVTNSGTGTNTVSITSAFGAGVTTVNQSSANSTLSINATNSADAITYNINSGTLTIGNNNNAIGSKSTVNFANSAGVTLALGGTGNVNIGALTGGGTVGGTLTHSGSLNINGTNINATYGGTITGAGDITFALTGTQTLNGAMTYTGNSAFTVSSGLVVIGSTGSVGAGTVGTATFNAYNNIISGTGNFTITAGGVFKAANATTLNTTGTFTDNGFFTDGQGSPLTAGTLAIGSTGTYGNTQAISVASGATLTEASGGVIGATGFLVGQGLNVNGGTVTLNSSANLYTGGTTVNQGLLQIGANAPSGAVGALGNAAGSVTLGGLNTSSSGTYTGGASILTDTGGITISRGISVASINGTGTYVTNSSLTVGGNQATGTSTYTGAIVMQPALTGTFVESPALTLTSAAGGVVNFNDVISGANNIIISGGGLVQLTGTSTFGGSANMITLQSGTLTSLNAGSNLGNAANILAFKGGTYQFGSGSSFDLSSRTIGFLSAGGTIDTNGNTVTLANAIGNGGTGSYTGGLTVSDSTGTGTLILGAANNYSGGTTVAKGTLETTATGALGSSSGALAVNTNGNLDLHGTSQNAGNLSGTGGNIYNNGSGTSTLTIGNGNNGGGSFAGVIKDNSGTGGQTALTKTGNGTITLAGASTYTGATTVGGGVLNLAGGASLGATAVSVGNGGTLLIGTGGNTIVATIGSASGGSLTVNSGGALSFTSGIVGGGDSSIKNLNVNGLSGTALTLSGGTLNIGLGGSVSDEIVLGSGLGTSLSGAITINLNVLSTLSTGSIQLISYGSGGTNSNSATYSIVAKGGVSTSGDSFSIVSTSSGLYLDVSATSFAYWKGAGTSWSNISNFTSDSGGTTTRTAALDNQTSVVFIATGGSNYANTTLDGTPVINNLEFAVAGVGIANGNSGANSLTIKGSTGIAVDNGVGSGTETISANVILGGAQTWTITNAASTLAVSGTISGSSTASLVKAGSGTLVLSGVNTYSGATTVSGGYLNIQSSDALDGTSSVTVNAGGALQMQGGVTTTNSPNLTINGTGTGGGGALESINDGNSYTGAITLGSASSIGSDAGNFSLSGSTINNNGNTLTLVGAGNGYVSDVIGGSGGLTLSGTGLWIIDAVNTYTGTTTINSGTLQVSTATSTLPGNPTLGNTGNTLAINGGTLDMAGYDVTIGNLTGSSGTITDLEPFEVHLKLGTTTNSSFGGSIVDNAANGNIIDLTKVNTGTQTLTGSNSYSGTTTVSAGALNIASSNALSANTSVVVSSGAALQLSGGITAKAASLSLVGAGTTGSPAGALENVSGNNTYTGAISLLGSTSLGSDSGTLTLGSTSTITGSNTNLTLVGAGGGVISDVIATGSGNLTMNSTGTWTLSGSNSYTGATNVNAGTLDFKVGALQSSSAINIGSSTGVTALNSIGAGGTLTAPVNFSGANAITLGNIGTGSITYSGSLTFAGSNITLDLGNSTDTIGGTIGNIVNATGYTTSLVKNGATNSTWVLTGSNSYTGATTINGGALQVAGQSTLGTGILNLNGSSTSFAVLQTNGSVTLNATTGQQLSWGSYSGFASNGGNLTLNIANGTTLVFGGGGSTNIGGGGGSNVAVFGTSTATGTVLLANNINLNSSDAYQANFYVAGAGESVVLSGTLTNGSGTSAASGLNKVGNGTLILTNGNSTYSGATSVIGGTLVAEASSTITVATSTSTSTGVFGSGNGPSTNPAPATYAPIQLGNTVGGGGQALGGVINPTLLVGSPTIGGTTSISNPVSVLWNNGTGQVYGIGGYTDSNNTFAGLITLNGTAATGNSFAVTQVGTTGTDALNITGGITAAGAGGNVNFANVGAVNVSSTAISNGTGTLSVTQSGTGTTTFSAANTYTGATTVSAGLLRINGSLTASPVTVNGGALGGTGTISGGVSLNAGGSINLADGTIGTLTVGSLTIGSGASAMTFDIGAGSTGNLDSIADLGALSISGTTAITVGFVSGTPLLTTGTYTLISSSNFNSSLLGDFSLTNSTLGNYALSLASGGSTGGLELVVTSNLAPTTYFYTGTVSTDFTNYQNFTTGANNGTTQTVGLTATSDVTIGSTSPTPANLTPVANSNVTIDSLTFATSGSGATLSGTGTVTIAASGNGGIGIADNANIATGTETISTALVLGGSQATQTWTSSASSTLRVTGAISGSEGLALTGAGTYRLAGANTFSGLTVGTGSDTPSVYLANGTNGSATGTTTFTVKAGATLGGKGTSSGTSFTLAGTGTASSARVSVLAGLISATDTNTTGVLTVKGSVGTSSIADANLSFNLDAKSASSTQINVGATNVAFGTDSIGSVKLTLNVQNEPAIIANNTTYTLIAGTGLTSITPGSSTGQYTGLTLGATTNLGGGVTETVITGNNLQLAFGSQIDQTYYANSYLVLYQSAGVDDIDVVVVPEPGTWAMMLGGLAALFFWQRRRSKA